MHISPAVFRRRRRPPIIITDFVPAELAWQDGPPTLTAFGATAYSRALARNAEHQVLPGPYQPTITYSSGTPANATVDSSTGLVTAVANGTSLITATATIGGNPVSITQTATVSQTMASITGVSSTLSGTDADSPTTLAPVGKDATNHTVSGATFSVVSDQPSVASVSGLVVTLQGPGTAHLTITASPGGATFVVTVTVTHAAAVTLSATPSSISGTTGDSGAFTEAHLSNAPATDIHSRLTWTTSNPAIVTIDPPTFTAISPTTISQGSSGSYTLTGTNTRPSGQSLAGLPTGVSASSFAQTDSTHWSVTLTATGSATLGAASLSISDPTHGNSGTQSLSVTTSGPPSVGTTATPALYIHADYGVTLNGSNAASITDQSTNGYVFSQATTGAQPAVVSGVYNGHACLRFTGSQYLTATAVLSALASTQFTVMVIGTCTDTAGGGARKAFYNKGSSAGFGIGEDTAFRWAGLTEAFDSPFSPAAENSALHALIYKGDAAGNNTGYRDSTSSVNLGGTTRATNTTTVAAIGGTSTGTGLWKGDIACIVAWPSALNSSNISAAISFARTQFGTP